MYTQNKAGDEKRKKNALTEERRIKMYDGLLTGGMLMLLLVVIAVNFLKMVKELLDWYRTTKHVAFKTNMTVAELQRMLANRRLRPQNR